MANSPRIARSPKDDVAIYSNPEIIYLDDAAQGLPHAREILHRAGDVACEVIKDKSWLQPTPSTGKRWFLTYGNDRHLKALKPGGDGVARFSLDLAGGAPYDLSYSPARIRPDHSLINIDTNVMGVIAEVTKKVAAAPRRQFRIRIGNDGDALALDGVTLFSHTLVPFFALMPNATLELRTRTDNVNHILNLGHQGKTVITFMINPRGLIASEERGTASLLERLIAARRCLNAGYRVAFAIDPIVRCHNWQRLYDELLDELFTHIPPESCDSIDLACLHYPRGLPESALKDFPGSHIFFDEFVPVRGEYRYFRPIRENVYRWFGEALVRRQLPAQSLRAIA